MSAPVGRKNTNAMVIITPVRIIIIGQINNYYVCMYSTNHVSVQFMKN